MTDTPIYAVLYAAKSTQDKNLSIPEQLDDCRKMAAGYRYDEDGDLIPTDEPTWTIVSEFSDENFTAYTGNRGPGLVGAIALAKTTAAEHGQCFIVAQHTSRFARGDGAAPNAPRALVELWHEWARSNVRGRLVENDEAMSSSPAAAAQGEADHNDSKRKSKSVKKGLRRRAERGGYKGGPRPFGFELGQVIEHEAELIRRMFADTLNGVSQRTLAINLTDDGVRTMNGCRWRQSSIRRTLANEIYRGTIVDAELFDRVQSATNGASKRGGRSPKNGSHVLTRGVLRCGRCGGAMIAHVSTPNDPAWTPCESYVCSTRRDLGPDHCAQPAIRRSVVDEAFLGELNRRYLDHGESVRRVEALRAANLARAMEQVGIADEEFLQARTRLQRVVRAFQDGIIDADDYAIQRHDLLAEQDAAQSAVDTASKHAADLRNAAAVSDAEVFVCDQMRQLVLGAEGVGRAPNLPALRNLICRLFSSVELADLPVRFRFDPAGWTRDPLMVENGETTLALVPSLRWEHIDYDAPEHVRRGVLSLPDEAAEEWTPSHWSLSPFSESLFGPIVLDGVGGE